MCWDATLIAAAPGRRLGWPLLRPADHSEHATGNEQAMAALRTDVPAQRNVRHRRQILSGPRFYNGNSSDCEDVARRPSRRTLHPPPPAGRALTAPQDRGWDHVQSGGTSNADSTEVTVLPELSADGGMSDRRRVWMGWDGAAHWLVWGGRMRLNRVGTSVASRSRPPQPSAMDLARERPMP